MKQDGVLLLIPLTVACSHLACHKHKLKKKYKHLCSACTYACAALNAVVFRTFVLVPVLVHNYACVEHGLTTMCVCIIMIVLSETSLPCACA